ncbi:hypothetical protein ACLB2K_010314 [Fragaria x ananassa]
MTAIEQSKLSIIIFSKRYASSSWCLDELMHILKCKDAYRQLVIPIFYHIDPAHVRKQEKSYAKALDIMEKRFNNDMDKVSKWREALTTAGNLSGFDSRTITNEAELVEIIVQDIESKLFPSLSDDSNNLVGTEGRIRQIESLLSIHTHDVPFRSVGIWGTGGIGKTTLAEAIYHQYFLQFEACSFLANVREKAEKYGRDRLKNKLLCDLLKQDNPCIGNPSIESTLVRTRLSRTKVLIVLDDVSDLMQLKLLVGDPVQFGPGSRIIITTRDRDVLKELVEDDHTYEVKGLETDESIHLFRSIAFKDNSFSNIDYLDLSREVVGYAQGIPLSLRVLGSLFRDCDSWKKELQKLKKFRNKNIEDVLRLSYDCLKENEKNIFLDIACFMKGEKRCDAERVLQMHGLLDAARGIDNLINTSLISISMDDGLEIHDLVEEMGQSIAQAHFPPWQRIRLWKFEDVCRVIGPSTVEALFLDISKIPRRQLIGYTYELFRHMPKLRSLKFYVPIESYDLCGQKKRMDLSRWKELLDVNDLKEYSTMHRCIIGGLESLPENLSYLYWDGYPYKYLPSKSPYNLFELHMPHSKVKKLLWTNGQTPRNLRVINLRDSRNLTEVPDLSHSPSIERIDLSGCSRFRNLNYCDGDRNRILLKELLMSWCTKLGSVPDSICNMSCLETLDLRGCRKLKRLPPFSVGHYFCSLRRLNLSWCNKLEIPDGLICLSSLQEIGLSGTMIKSIPASIKNAFKLRKLLLNYCKKLQSLPELPSLLEILEADGCTSLKTVATSSNAPIQDGAPDCNPREKLMFTKSLDQSRKIELLEYLQHAKKASSAHTKSDHGVPKLIQHNAPWLGERHIFTNCFKLDESSRNNITDDAQLRIMRIASSKREYGTVFATCPGNDIPGWFSYQEEGCSITIKIPQTDDENFSGFAISAVFASQNQGWDNLFRLKCDCNFKTDDGKGYEFKFESPLVISMENPPSSVNVEDKDNVLVLFQKDMFCGIPNIPLDKITEASFSFSPEYCYDDDDQEKEVCSVKVKKCGIQILYAL